MIISSASCFIRVVSREGPRVAIRAEVVEVQAKGASDGGEAGKKGILSGRIKIRLDRGSSALESSFELA